MSTTPAKPPEILDKIVDVVLAHRPKPKKSASDKAKSLAKPSNKKDKHKKRDPKITETISDAPFGLLLR